MLLKLSAGLSHAFPVLATFNGLSNFFFAVTVCPLATDTSGAAAGAGSSAACCPISAAGGTGFTIGGTGGSG